MPLVSWQRVCEKLDAEFVAHERIDVTTEGARWALEAAPEGLAGIQAVESNRPDILLLDIIMPRLDGFGVIEKLRANPQTRDLPIVVLSAKEMTSAESARLKETVSGVMKKQGLQGVRLVDAIDQALRRSLLAQGSQGD